MGDAIVMELSFIVALVIRHGTDRLFANMLDVNIAVLVVMADLCIGFFSEEYRGILRRGYYKEFKKALKHVTLIVLGVSKVLERGF